MKKSNYFPLVGIFASKGRKKDTFRGDVPFYKAIQKELTQYGGLSFVFTTEGIQKNNITGYVYFSEKEKWGKVTFPYPDVIYNKISSRKEEKTDKFLTIQQNYYQKNKPFFNPFFFDKWDTFQALSREKHLQKHLPRTWLFTKKLNIDSMLSTNKAFYVKPVNGHKGNGINKIMMENNHYLVQSKTKKTFYNRRDFQSWIDRHLKKQAYLLQEEIITDKIDDCKYDLRILCLHKHGVYSPVGIGVRKAMKDSIITHVPNGGEIIAFDQVSNRCSMNQIKWLAEKVGNCLTTSFGFVGEFSMDIGVTLNGFPIIFEVNSKPMVFDEKDIQQQRIKDLCGLFIQRP